MNNRGPRFQITCPHLKSLVCARLRAQTLDARAPRLLFERALLRAARAACGDAFGRASVQTRDLLAQLPQTDHLVPVLAALLAACDDDSGRQVPEPHSRLYLVDVLAARPSRAERVELALAQQFLV